MAEGCNSPVFYPETLYQLSVAVIVKNLQNFEHLYYLPNDLLFDIYYELYKEMKLRLMEKAFSDLKIFSKMVTVTDRRVHLLQCFQILKAHGIRCDKELRTSYRICHRHVSKDEVAERKLINLGLRIGEFLSDAGWYKKSEQVLLDCKKLCIANNNTPEDWCRTLGCYRSLLHVQAAHCRFLQAQMTYELTVELIEKLQAIEYDYNYAALYTEFSVFFYMKGKYDEAYRWSIAALKELKPTLSACVTINVLRQAAKSCVLKGEFRRAGLLIKEAVHLAKEVFGVNHLVYSNVLIDYGYYWLNFDSIVNSVAVYKEALAIRKKIFGVMNLHVALAHEDLAYALYVYEYRSGTFPETIGHIRKAIWIMKNVLRGGHLLLASANRIYALILEEMTFDHTLTPLLKKRMLLKAHMLHLLALKSAENVFGEENVQTAKHYGNLGRVYQSMTKFKEAEEMHLKAIRIKEQLLGPDDHEVGLSLGHLASLYSYHMNRYRAAEELYHRSIAISLKLFGKSYSGLEYDYHGLVNAYLLLNDLDKVAEYERKLADWRELRSKNVQTEDPINPKGHSQPIKDVIKAFFDL